MDLQIKDKVAFVTAGSQGLGFASAKSLLQEGVKVIISSSNQSNIDKALDQLREIGGSAEGFVVDYKDSKALLECANNIKQKYGKIDILVCSSGGPKPGNITDLDDEDYEVSFRENFVPFMKLINAVSQDMQKQKWGRIIIVTSLSVIEPMRNLALSNVIRSSVNSYAKTLSVELAPFGVTVNCVMPGLIYTNRIFQLTTLKAAQGTMSFEEQKQIDENAIPMQRFGETQEFGDTVCFLASNKASYITGSSIGVDGGMQKSI